ncbi:ATP-binding protein [Paenibacillus peoriae]|uniref:ATP-binding protein n=1 Tax=Paenibacillus peoriae TaxID=59893 RepID=UPI00026C5A16|nr:ATP-binding protein [Paenibacillus peoriae]MEC0181343.1 ATP-binding protein [Paenibacillus peoriae]
MNISLPSRYEDLDEAYKGRLIPNESLLTMVNQAQKAMRINGGIRFLPIYGESGAGKTSAAMEISTHIPSVRTFALERDEIEGKDTLIARIRREHDLYKSKILVAIVDQYEENVAGKEKIPTQFVEYLSLLDRGEFRRIPIIFIWLTTNREFQQSLVQATSRNKRILINGEFSILGPSKDEWPKIIEETFSFHNSENSLADFGIIESDIINISFDCTTLGSAIENISNKLGENLDDVQNFSEYQVIIMWPVADALRSQRILQFSKPREGYKLNWDWWYRELNSEEKNQLPLRELNRTRLYFDIRIVPIRVADLHKLCGDLENENAKYGKSYIGRFQKTHLYQVVSNSWDSYDYTPLKERESKRAEEARTWYATVTDKPVALGRRIARIFRDSGIEATHEVTLNSSYSSVRADIFIKRPDIPKNKVIIELKAFASENTMPSTIKDAIRITLRRHAQFAGFIQRQ